MSYDKNIYGGAVCVISAVTLINVKPRLFTNKLKEFSKCPQENIHVEGIH